MAILLNLVKSIYIGHGNDESRIYCKHNFINCDCTGYQEQVTRHSFSCGQPLGPGSAHHCMRNLIHH